MSETENRDEQHDEHSSKEHGPISESVRNTDPPEDDDVGLVGGGGPAAAMEGTEELGPDDHRADGDH